MDLTSVFILVVIIGLVACVLYVHESPSVEKIHVKVKAPTLQMNNAPQVTPTPELQRLQSLLVDFTRNSNWGALLAMGDIYHRGAFPRLAPNVAMAVDIFRIVATCPNGEMAALGQAKVVELRVQELFSDDVHGTPMPIAFGAQACRAARDILAHTPDRAYERPKIKVVEPAGTITDILPTTLPTIATTMHPNILTNILPASRQERIDSQNVHDHAVSRITRHNVEQLDKSTDINAISKTQTFENVTNAILSNDDLGADTKGNALRTLDALNSHHNTSLGIAEDQALMLVWDRIEKQKDDAVRANLKDSLAKQLASAVEHGNVVCSSGKITRILGTLDGIEDGEVELQAPKPLWALRDELGSLAAKVRDEEGDDDNNAERAIDAFAKAARAEYIDRLGMHRQIIEPLIAEYSAGF